LHHYAYPGDYVAVLDVASGEYSAGDHIFVQVIPASVTITQIAEGPDGFIELTNSAGKELDISWWRLRVGEWYFTIPKNTRILPNTSIKFSSAVTNLFAEGAGQTKLLYPNGEIAVVYDEEPLTPPIIKNQKVSAVVPAGERAIPSATPTLGQSLAQGTILDGVGQDLDEKSQDEQGPTPGPGLAPAVVLYTAGEDGMATPLYIWVLILVGVTFLAVGGVIFIRRRETAPRSSAEIAEEIEIIEE